MPVHLEIPESTIEALQFSVAGWVAGAEDCAAVRVTVNGREVDHSRHERPDVRRAVAPLAFAAGIAARVDLLTLPAAKQVEISLAFGPEKVERIVDVSKETYGCWRDDCQLRLAHRKFCLVRLICPACGAAAEELQILPHAISCLRCGTHFAQATRALNLISGPLALAANIAETDLVSANPYTPEALSLIERVTGKGGMVLDCGAGARPKRTSNVINLEIVDYASSDVLAVGESLPFADGSFDAVMSLAVLEHVRDPFRCARELTRVLKSGGEILADVPFLQPVHGYPHHYYNMTAQGLRNLFAADTTEIGHAVPNHGHPIFAVQWILREYRAGLPSGRAEEFAAMQVASLIDLDIPRFLGDPKARELAIQSRETIACLNSLHLRKN